LKNGYYDPRDEFERSLFEHYAIAVHRPIYNEGWLAHVVVDPASPWGRRREKSRLVVSKECFGLKTQGQLNISLDCKKMKRINIIL